MTDNIETFNKIKSGDLKAFKHLFDGLYPSMCSIANSYIKDEDKSRDIAQEAFISLWNKREYYDSITSLKTFLYVSVKNLSLNYIRDKREEYITDEELHDKIGVAFKNLVIEEEAIRIVNIAIENLPPQSSKIIKMGLTGMKNMEIAERLEISVNSVKTLKYNAMKALKVVLKDYYLILLIFLENN